MKNFLNILAESDIELCKRVTTILEQNLSLSDERAIDRILQDYVNTVSGRAYEDGMQRERDHG